MVSTGILPSGSLAHLVRWCVCNNWVIVDASSNTECVSEKLVTSTSKMWLRFNQMNEWKKDWVFLGINAWIYDRRGGRSQGAV